jgi:hypothetical protein
MLYYRETNGDYLAVDPTSADHYKRHGLQQLEGRASAISGRPSSVCTLSISLEFLKTCKPVRLADIPKEWSQMF